MAGSYTSSSTNNRSSSFSFFSHYRRSYLTSYFLYFSKELQADVARQQRVLANVALIEARDRAEEQDRMRIRQEDRNMSQRALLASSDEQERSGKQNDSADGTKTTGSDTREEQKNSLEGEVKEVVLNSGTLAQANGPKIRPPTFLTPAKSPKSQTTTTPIFSSAFTAPPDLSRNTGQSTFGREHQCQQTKADTEPLDATQSAGSDSAGFKTQKSTNGANPLPVMPSRVTETESWVPKARARR